MILLAAAILKGHLLATDPFAPTGVPGPRWLAVVFVELEFFLAIWLLSGLFALAARRVAIIAFIGFAGVSLYRAVAGEVSCGCFGRFEVSPWITFGFDLAAVTVLVFLWRANSPSNSSFVADRLWIIAISIGALSIGAFGAVKMSPRWSRGTPTLIPDQASFNFGTLPALQFQNPLHVFRLFNTTNHPIRIVSSRTTCGCTVAKTPAKPIAPGATAEVEVSVDWANRAGRRMEEVHLTTDDPLTPGVVLSVSGVVRSMASLAPEAIHFGGLRLGQTASRIVNVRPAMGGNLRITSVEASNRQISVMRASDRGQLETSWPLSGSPGAFCITFCAGNTGWQSGSVIFHTDHSTGSTLALAVTADVSPPFNVMPGALFFPDFSADAVKNLLVSVDRRRTTSRSPSAKLLLAPDGTAPFDVSCNDEASSPEQGVWRFVVRARPRDVTEDVCRCVLRVTMGEEHVDVPIVAIRPKSIEPTR